MIMILFGWVVVVVVTVLATTITGLAMLEAMHEVAAKGRSVQG